MKRKELKDNMKRGEINREMKMEIAQGDMGLKQKNLWDS
jgi:hypothetical protein